MIAEQVGGLSVRLTPRERMAELTPAIADSLLAVWRQNGTDIDGALSRSLDGEFTFSLPETSALYRQANPAGAPAPPPKPKRAPAAKTSEDDPFDRLPPYIRSMLSVEVSIQVTLATKKETIQNITELAPGSIIRFDKACDQLLDLEVGDCRIAQGEAVKIGEKFGLRISSMVLPDERFEPLLG